MEEQQHHEELVKGVAKEQKFILDRSPLAIYIYLDDTHKVCNKKFAELIGYKSASEWARMDAPLADVVEEYQQAVIDAYTKASEQLIPGQLEIKMRNVKTAKILKVNLFLTPIMYGGHVLVMHFLKMV